VEADAACGYFPPGQLVEGVGELGELDLLDLRYECGMDFSHDDAPLADTECQYSI
jgi:hypothetical protein